MIANSTSSVWAPLHTSTRKLLSLSDLSDCITLNTSFALLHMTFDTAGTFVLRAVFENAVSVMSGEVEFSVKGGMK